MIAPPQNGLGSKPGVLFSDVVARMKYPRAWPMAPLHSNDVLRLLAKEGLHMGLVKIQDFKKFFQRVHSSWRKQALE